MHAIMTTVWRNKYKSVCVCVCVGVGEEVKGEKKSVRDGRSEQGPGGTRRRHQSIGPTAVHSGL